MFTLRPHLALVVLASLVVTSAALAAKSAQEKSFQARCTQGVANFRATTKDRTTLSSTLLKGLAEEVKLAQKTPIVALDAVVAEASDCLVDILQAAAEESLLVEQLGSDLLLELNGPRPKDFQLGTGGALDDYHAAIAKELEVARKKLEKALFAYSNRVLTATDGDFEHRIVVPNLGAFSVAAPNAGDSVGTLDNDVHPSRILVAIGAGSKLAPNDGRIVIAGQVFVNPFDPIDVDVDITNASVAAKVGVDIDAYGRWQTSFTGLAPRNYQLWAEQDPVHNAAVGDAGGLALTAVSVP